MLVIMIQINLLTPLNLTPIINPHVSLPLLSPAAGNANAPGLQVSLRGEKVLSFVFLLSWIILNGWHCEIMLTITWH